MSELVGRTLEHYLIAEKIGAGGMGKVYRARDNRLDRDVAIKVLPEEVAGDPERLARFEREAKLLASLSHPNIATLYGLEEHEGTRYLAMELAEGETLADRIARGRLSVDESLAFAVQIADGLEAAHGRGIVHRDLKPANVMVSPDGRIKILDFGLAKAWLDDLSGADSAESPTITAEMTAEGVLLGTAAYMSPEQARAGRVDKRTDIWSFGVVLYEMLTGSNPVAGDSTGETIGNVLHKEIDLDQLPPLPPNVRRALRRCLERKPKQRYRDIGDVRLELEQPGEVETPVEPAIGGPRKPWLRAVIVLGMIAAAAFLGWTIRGGGSTPVSPLIEADIALPEGHRLSGPTLPSFSLSPDGRQLAFFTGPEPDDWSSSDWVVPTQLVLRRLDRAQGVPVAGVGWGTTPVFSPDGRWIAYLDDALYKIPVGGGQPSRLNSNGDLYSGTVVGLSWGKDGDLVLGMRDGGLQRLSEQGGESEALTELDEGLGEFRHCLPSHLPDGRAILFTVFRYHVSNPEPSARSVWALRLDSGERYHLMDDASHARFSSGQVLFMRDGDLMAAPFDPSRLELTGVPRKLKADVHHAINTPGTNSWTGVGYYDVAPNGTLVYVDGGAFQGLPGTVAWVDRSGSFAPVDVEPRKYLSVRVSPDGSSLLLWDRDWDNPAVWVHDLKRGASRRELSGAFYQWSIWGPEPDRITTSRSTETGSEIVTARVGAGSSGPTVLPSSVSVFGVAEWTRDGRLLACCDGNSAIWLCSREGPCQKVPKQDGVGEWFPAISPDSRWLAFASDESSHTQVYVRSLADLEQIHQVSFNGGSQPAWSRDGSELLFIGPGDGMYAADIEHDSPGGLSIGEPELLFTLDRYSNTHPVRSWDVAPDGRFVFIVPAAKEDVAAKNERHCPDRIRIVQGWPALLDQ